MGAAIFLLAILGIGMLYLYINVPPKNASNPRALTTYNQMVYAVCFMLSAAWFFKARAMWMGTSDDKWWLPMGIGGALLIEIFFLGICFILRNFWIFKPPRSPFGF